MEQSLEEYLYQAICDHDIDNVSVLLSKGANPNTPIYYGLTCLCGAASMGNIDILNLLISACRNSDTTIKPAFKDGRRHSRKCHKRKLKCDEQNGGTSIKCKNLNDTKENDQSDGNRGYFVFIHSEGSSSDESRITSMRSPQSPTSLLPSPQADLEWDEEIGNSAPTTSEDEEWTSMYKWYAAILETSGTYIAAAAMVNDGINQQDAYSKTALHYAVEDGNGSCVKVLLEAGAKADVADCDGLTPLHIAAMNNDIKTVELLIEVGANVNNMTHEKTAPLHYASKKGLLDLVKCLVQNGANLEVRDSEECTALYLAVRNGHLDVVRYLTSCGANVNGEDIRGHTPLYQAVWNKNTAMVEVLLNYGARITHTHYLLHWSILRKQEEIVKLLLQHGGSINLHNENGDTPLLAALRTSQLHIAKLLLLKGANVNATNSITGISALHMVLNCISEDKFEDIFNCLIEHNIDLNVVATLLGDTPLNRALSSNKDIAAALLIRHGADVNICDMQFNTLDNLSRASLRKTCNLASMLIKAGHHAVQVDPIALEKTDCAAQWVYNACRNPLRLSDICRIKIRSMCFRSRPLFKYIDNLPLPSSLKRFLMMENES